MMRTAFLIFTVSTLAAQINAVPTNDRIYDPCEGKTYCFEKPPDYPQEKMDILVAQSDLQHLHRIKREAQQDFKKIDKNGCVESSEMVPVYRATDINNRTLNVVQSLWLSQTIPNIKCKTKKPCFASLGIGKFICQPTTSKMNLFMANDENTEAKLHEISITTGCFCAKQLKENKK